MKNKTESNGFPKIDKIVHEPARLMIMTFLYVIDSSDFLFLMRQTGLTKGNLSSHMNKLEDAGYVDIEKKFIDKIPRTMLKLSKKGRKAFKDYRNTIIELFKDMPE